MWTCIGFGSDTAESGDAFPLEFMELPLLILRGEDHQLRVFHNVCPHSNENHPRAGMEMVRMHQAGGWNRILSKEACWHVGIRENESRQ